MGKTKTFIVEGQKESEQSGKAAYEAKMAKKAAAEAAKQGEGEMKTDKNQQKQKHEDKDQVKGVGLKGGERIKVIGSEPVEETTAPAETTEVSPVSQKAKKAKVRSKNYKSAYSKFDKTKTYKLADGIKLLHQVSYSKFDPTVELHISTKTNPLNVNVTLPHQSGKQKVIEIASEKTIENLKSGKIEFDVLLATPEMMPKLVPFARLLGPRGLMPNPKNGTLVKSVKEAEKFSGNSMNLKTQKDSSVIHTSVGKLSLKDSDLQENIKAVLDAVGDKQIVRVFMKSTMSPSIKVTL